MKELKNLNFPWVRLGCYWSEIEAKENQFDFEDLERLIVLATKIGFKIVLTIGMKAPRWPEFYLPKWLEKKIYITDGYVFDKSNTTVVKRVKEYLLTAVERFKKYKSVKVWQVENEPLDPSGPKNCKISPELLMEEVETIRKVDNSRLFLVTVWGNDLTTRGYYKAAAQIGDIVGIDIYFRYNGPSDKDEKIKEVIKNMGKPVWITELQAEPWEPGEIVTKKKNPRSCLPKHIIQNYKRVKDFGAEAIFFWGFEWWLFRKVNGDDRWWRAVERVIKNKI
jgi:GH35 family endo-1,4-beta-xylanase